MMHQNFVTSFYLPVVDKLIIVVFVLMIWIITKLGQVMVEQLLSGNRALLLLRRYKFESR